MRENSAENKLWFFYKLGPRVSGFGDHQNPETRFWKTGPGLHSLPVILITPWLYIITNRIRGVQ